MMMMMKITGVLRRSNNLVSLSTKGLDGALHDMLLLDVPWQKKRRDKYELRGPMQVDKRTQNRIMKLDYLTLPRQVSLNVRLVLELQGCT